MKTPRVWRSAIAAAALSLLLTASAGASGSMKVLGTDAQNDAPPGGDLISLEVAQHGSDLHVRIGMSTLPSIGSYPEAGIQWSFSSRGRVFAVEAHQQSPGEYGFTLYEIKGGAFNVVTTVDGELDDGGFNIYVPLNAISASKGTVIKGAILEGADADVEIHQHAQVTSGIVDDFTTTKTFKVR